MNEEIPPPPTDPMPLQGRMPPGPPSTTTWVEQRVWDAWEEEWTTTWMKVESKNHVKIETTCPPLPPALQKQVDDYLEKEKRMKEEQQAEQNVYKNIKKEYENPYKKPVIPADILEGHDDDDDQFHSTKDWESTFIRSKTERMKNNPLIYPHWVDVNIFNHDESDYNDARSEGNGVRGPRGRLRLRS